MQTPSSSTTTTTTTAYGERLLRELDELLARHPLESLSDLGVVAELPPAEGDHGQCADDDQNRGGHGEAERPPSSPSFAIVEGRHLAVAAAAVAPLFLAARDTVIWRRGRSGAGGTLGAAEETADEEAVSKASRALVLLNPEHLTAWNARRRLVADGQLDVAGELAVVELVLSRHPKRAAPWSYR
ncbi:hypothetical protein HK405_012299, partial [Cladochytrium tenue]